MKFVQIVAALSALVFCGIRACSAFHKPLMIGDTVPGFSLLDDEGKSWNLEAYKGRFVVIYFYPSDDTPGCTQQACSINSWDKEFKKEGIVIVGISYNSVESHQAFKKKHRLGFPLLSDPQAKIADLFGASRWWPNLMPKRKTYVLDPNGVLRNVMSDVDPLAQGRNLIDIVKSLEGGAA